MLFVVDNGKSHLKYSWTDGMSSQSRTTHQSQRPVRVPLARRASPPLETGVQWESSTVPVTSMTESSHRHCHCLFSASHIPHSHPGVLIVPTLPAGDDVHKSMCA